MKIGQWLNIGHLSRFTIVLLYDVVKSSVNLEFKFKIFNIKKLILNII